jgi:hypothetical protein
MSAALEALARDKELLLARSAFCRLRLRSQSSALRDALGWRGMTVSAAASPGARGALLAIALSLPVLARTARFAIAAIRAVLLARLALSLIRHVRALGSTPPDPR